MGSTGGGLGGGGWGGIGGEPGRIRPRLGEAGPGRRQPASRPPVHPPPAGGTPDAAAPGGAEPAGVLRNSSRTSSRGSTGGEAGSAAPGDTAAPSPASPVSGSAARRPDLPGAPSGGPPGVARCSYASRTLPFASIVWPGSRAALVRPPGQRMRSPLPGAASMRAPAGLVVPVAVSAPLIHATRCPSLRSTTPLTVSGSAGGPLAGSGRGPGPAFPAAGSASVRRSGPSRSRSSSIRCSGLEKSRPIRGCVCGSAAGKRARRMIPSIPTGVHALRRRRTAGGNGATPGPSSVMPRGEPRIVRRNARAAPEATPGARATCRRDRRLPVAPRLPPAPARAQGAAPGAGRYATSRASPLTSVPRAGRT